MSDFEDWPPDEQSYDADAYAPNDDARNYLATVFYLEALVRDRPLTLPELRDCLAPIVEQFGAALLQRVASRLRRDARFRNWPRYRIESLIAPTVPTEMRVWRALQVADYLCGWDYGDRLACEDEPEF